MKISIEIDSFNEPSDYEKGVLLALAGGVPGRGIEVTLPTLPVEVKRDLAAELEEHDAADNDGLQETPAELEEHDVDEPSIPEQVGEAAEQRVSPYGFANPDREPGKPSPGKKRRNSDEVEEDRLYEERLKAQAAAPAAAEQPVAPEGGPSLTDAMQQGAWGPQQGDQPQQAAPAEQPQQAPAAAPGFGFGFPPAGQSAIAGGQVSNGGPAAGQQASPFTGF